MFLLADCNNFYVSCERVFNPSLRGRPVIILSNNDGCAVALSNEAKALGVPRGAPLFKWRDFLLKNNGVWLSSNYTLYGDMSRRVMDILSSFSEDCEVYSIDEAFLRIDISDEKTIQKIALEIMETVYKYTGIPLSVGSANTKTLAKAANHYAKKTAKTGFACITPANRESMLQQIPVSQIWGIGYRHDKLLKSHGVNSALQFTKLCETWIKKRMSITGLRTHKELNGTPCIDLQHVPPSRQSIVSSRSFGTPVSSFNLLNESIHEYGYRAAARMRSMKLVCSSLSVYLCTNRFKDEPQYSNSASVSLEYPTDSSRTITYQAEVILKAIYRSGYKYKKTGIMLHGLIENSEQQMSLFEKKDYMNRDEKLMSVMDSINRRYGSKSVILASEGISRNWQMKREFLTPSYTTRWSDIPLVKVESNKML